MVRIKVRETVTSTLNKKLKSLTTMATGSGNSIPDKVVKWGYYKAISLAPHDTGATKRAISIIKQKKGAKLRLNRPVQNRTDGKNDRDYHLWMHGIAGNAGKYDVNPTRFAQRIKSGTKFFMFETAKLMEQYAKDLATKEVKKKR